MAIDDPKDAFEQQYINARGNEDKSLATRHASHLIQGENQGVVQVRLGNLRRSELIKETRERIVSLGKIGKLLDFIVIFPYCDFAPDARVRLGADARCWKPAPPEDD